jgi:hypothetical protein
MQFFRTSTTTFRDGQRVLTNGKTNSWIQSSHSIHSILPSSNSLQILSPDLILNGISLLHMLNIASITSKNDTDILLVLTSNCLTLLDPLNLAILRKLELQSAQYAHISASGSLVAVAHQCDILLYLSLDSESTSQLSIPGVIHSIAFLPHTSLLLILHTLENGTHCISSYRSSHQSSFLLLHKGTWYSLI